MMESPQPPWIAVQQRVDEWVKIGASAHTVRAIRFGVMEVPSIPFTAEEGKELGDVPQTREDLAFGARKLEEGLKEGSFVEVTKEYAMLGKKTVR